MKITRAEANYTGGNIYIYTGKLEDGRFFLTADDWEDCVLIVDLDPQEHWDTDDEDDDCTFEGWQKAHTVQELVGRESLLFWRKMLDIIEKKETYEDWSSRIDYIRAELSKGEPMKEYEVTKLFHENGTVRIKARSEEEAIDIANDMEKGEFECELPYSEVIDVRPMAKLPFTGEPLYNLIKGRVKELVRNTLSDYGVDWIEDLSFSNRRFLRHDIASLAKALQLALEDPSVEMDD